MREYAALTVLVFCIVLLAVCAVTDAVAGAMDNMANVVAEGSHNG